MSALDKSEEEWDSCLNGQEILQHAGGGVRKWLDNDDTQFQFSLR